MITLLRNKLAAELGRAVVMYCLCLTCGVCSPAVGEQPSSTTRLATAASTSVNGSPANPSSDLAQASLVIGPEDVLAIDVWKEPELSRSFPVRPDGKISLPLIGDITASGLTPQQLQQSIANKLHTFISEPEVTVIVQEVKSQHFNILGQVVRPGSYQLTPSMTVIDAIAVAGGLRDFAKRKAIYVLRESADGKECRIPFNYKSVIKGGDLRQNIRVASLDTIVVP